MVESPFISSYIMVNNIRVCMYAVGGGITAGLFTAYSLISNGIIGGQSGRSRKQRTCRLLVLVGDFASRRARTHRHRHRGRAGLVLARALFAPGELPRRDALRLAGADAAQLMLGVAVMLVIAGTIEGYLTPSFLPPTFKMAFAALTAVLLVVYFGLKPRARAPRPA